MKCFFTLTQNKKRSEDIKKEKADFLEVNKLLNRVEKQHEELRKVNGEGEPYKHFTKQKHVTVYTNDKKAMKFWKE